MIPLGACFSSRSSRQMHVASCTASKHSDPKGRINRRHLGGLLKPGIILDLLIAQRQTYTYMLSGVIVGTYFLACLLRHSTRSHIFGSLFSRPKKRPHPSTEALQQWDARHASVDITFEVDQDENIEGNTIKSTHVENISLQEVQVDNRGFRFAVLRRRRRDLLTESLTSRREGVLEHDPGGPSYPLSHVEGMHIRNAHDLVGQVLHSWVCGPLGTFYCCSL